MRIRLADADRERLGCPEWVEYDPNKLGLREAAALKRETGYTPEMLSRRLQGTAQFDTATGEPLTEPVLDEHQQPVIGEDGQPKTKLLLEPDYEAWAAVVWLALRRAGTLIAFADFDIEIGFDVEDSAGDGDAGKEPAPSTTTSS